MQKHWVEELFPPTYTYSIDSLLKASTITDSDNAGTRHRHSEKLDTTSNIKDLYERVRVNFNQEAEERRQKSTQAGSPLSLSFNRDQDLQPRWKDTARRSQSLSGSREKLPDKDDNDCMWSKSELKILRDDHKKAKTELANILVQLKVVEEEKFKLEERFQKEERKLKMLVESLHLSQQKCKRFSIRSDHLESEVRLSNGKVKMLEEDVTDLLQEKRTLKKVLREVRKELDQERRIRADFELQLQEVHHKLKMKHIAREEGLKLDYQMQINRLYEELREAQETLEKEQREHGINKKALNHLRTHFASLPVGETKSSLPGGPIKSW